ncbi:MAG: RNA polymerase sigma-70 factor, ECF subfamily [Parcubacteria group bacterium LiPW_15]|nr:MAG: RNA polymerase sigma-70 factor, ECF subfamily [Parcubacteria group bacterium LiPW_15]
MLDGEEKIVALAIGGDPKAFGTLYDHYQPQIYRFLFLKVAGREEAEDLTHQVFLNAWLGIPRYKHRGYPFSSWLYQIARNQVVDHYRARRETVSLEETDPEAFADKFSEGDLDKNLEVERVMAVIRDLKQEYQDVLILRFVEDLSVKEVASTMDKSEGAIKLLQHRALRVLREKLGESHLESSEETDDIDNNE